MIKDFIEKYWNSNRLLLGYSSFDLLEGIKDVFDEIKISPYKSGQRVMTWRAPEEWVVHEAYIEDEQGNRYLDYEDNPLHLVAYSTSIDKWMSWQELDNHLQWSDDGIPWKFKYYERDWGFCAHFWDYAYIINKNNKYHVVINTEFKQGTMLVGELQLGNRGTSNLLIASHYDHPYQANDGLSGVAVALEVYKRLKENPPDWVGGVRFLFVPETIGSIAYFTDHRWDDIVGGIFLDACGNDNKITLQHSFDPPNYIDGITEDVLKNDCGLDYNIAEFREHFCNDEIVINSPPMNIPCIGLSRAPYPEYHTSADTPDIIQEGKLRTVADVVEEIARRIGTDYIPIHTYSGVPFLSGYDLWVDWAENQELNMNIEKIFMRFDGKHTITDISDDIGMNYWDVREYVEKFRTAGLIKIYPVNGE